MATNREICEPCRAQLFNPTTFPAVFVGVDFEDGVGGVWLVRSLRELAANCNFCSLLGKLLREANISEDESITIRVYASSLSGKRPEDVSILFLDAAQNGCHRYTLHVGKDDPAATFISTREPNPLVDLPRNFEIARTWLKECDENHTTCHRLVSQMPTRVLDVAPNGNANSVRLFTTKSIEAQYVTLSYCWGAPQPKMLTTTNHKAYLAGIDIATLPRSIQDSVRVVRELGLRYLWVDSLCILQDSPDDKIHEIVRMADIYQNSYLTLFASSAATCEDGFLARQEPPELKTIPVPVFNAETSGTMLLRPWTSQSDYDPTQDPASSRAWIFQERMLSPRLLIYPSSPHSMQWQCLSSKKADGGSIPNTEESGFEQLGPEFHSRQSNANAPDDLSQRRLWARVLQNYTSRFLTNGADKLPAMAGVASQFARIRGSRGGQYCAGLWRNDMPMELLWRVYPGDPAQFEKPPERPRAPSWSWVSSDVQVLLQTQLPTHPRQFEILDCQVDLVSPDSPFGEVKGGILTVRALLKGCRWEKHPRRLVDGSVSVGQGIADDVRARGSTDVYCMPVLDSKHYPPYLATGLLLERSGANFKRVGTIIVQKHDWFDDCTAQELSII